MQNAFQFVYILLGRTIRSTKFNGNIRIIERAGERDVFSLSLSHTHTTIRRPKNSISCFSSVRKSLFRLCALHSLFLSLSNELWNEWVRGRGTAEKLQKKPEWTHNEKPRINVRNRCARFATTTRINRISSLYVSVGRLLSFISSEIEIGWIALNETMLIIISPQHYCYYCLI